MTPWTIAALVLGYIVIDVWLLCQILDWLFETKRRKRDGGKS